VRQLFEENCALSQKYQDIQRAKRAEDLENKKKLESLQELLDNRNRQVKELWNVIRRLDGENMMFKNEAEDRKEVKRLNTESSDTSDDDSKNNIFLFCNKADCRQKLHQEFSAGVSRNRRDCEEKFNESLRPWGVSDAKKTFKHMHKKVVSTTKLQSLSAGRPSFKCKEE